jgi:selenide,water dikinase
VLSRLAPGEADELMVGFETADDAAVYRLGEDTAVLLTVDFFTPIVDDPFDFGRITAANALSDVYAMGGRPLAAMNLVALACSLGADVVARILEGGAAKVREAGAVVVGGHTIDDPEPKYGLSVLGVAHPDAVVRNAGAVPGDELVLTKPIGTGVMTTALKRGLETEESIADVIESMAELNRAACEAMLEVGAHACTDITGFGLVGHVHEMAEASAAAAELDLDAVPVFERALDRSAEGVRPGRTAEVLEYLDRFTDWGPADDRWRGVLGDPQTSGGLLVAVEHGRADELVSGVERRGGTAACVGRIAEGAAGDVRIR